MYSRNLDGDTLELGVSGKLWHGVLVMFDRGTGSLWTQLDGRAVQGPHQGQRLEHRESVFTTWDEWRQAHPDTLVLEKSAEESQQSSSHYADYFADPDALMFDSLSDVGGGMTPKDVVFGVLAGNGALAVRESVLAETNVHNAVVGGRPVALLRSPTTGAVIAIDRQIDGRVVVLEALPSADPTVKARDTLSGQTVDVADRPRLRVDRSYWYAWARSHPHTESHTVE